MYRRSMSTRSISTRSVSKTTGAVPSVSVTFLFLQRLSYALLSVVSVALTLFPTQLLAQITQTEENKPYKICAVYPHLKDSYWLSINYGMVEEATNLPITLKVLESGGYPNRDKQKQQLKDCVDWSADAIILGTVAPNLYRDDLFQLTGTTPIFAAVNHLELNDANLPLLKGTVGVDWYWMGHSTGHYLLGKHPTGSGKVNIALLPGPVSSGGTKPVIQGFIDAIEGSDIHIVETQWADNDKELQRNLVQELIENNDLDYLVGSAVAIEAAISEIRIMGKTDQIKLVSTYLSHGVYRGIVRGRVEFAPTDQMVMQGRLSVQQAYRFLSHKPYARNEAPAIQSITRSDFQADSILNSLSPSGYRPTFSVRPID
ncbi:TMAO reductase system periplasmic protein TorT [Vibrio genomosp. F10]|uniref:TMAO reductase system periplasmic protein TorT n=1 Tax=Vibrio genomosp. F10 TaxID=723171 RepID=A0A1B9QYW2_9VIBR|nr:TMAO reductase system periplasmic protein TorT [Vibrio genomosp. F10]OCH75623.1 TMAO reductase system periplasmic protein TorT [Vibrio genomosp. F10]